MSKELKSSVIPVRLSDAVVGRLDAVAAMIGTTRTALIRLCADTFAGHIEKGGKAALPIDWRDNLAAHDGRTLKAKSRIDHTAAKLNCTLNDELLSSSPLPPPQRVTYSAKKSIRRPAKKKP